MENEFSVYQFFIDGSYEAVRRFVVMEEAAKAFTHYATSVGVTLGFVTRVIITDGGDNTVAEWTRHDGVTWPGAGSGDQGPPS